MNKAHQPLVTVVVPTRNSARFLRACLNSIREQSYPAIELIVVDRDSTDATKLVAEEYADQVLNYGPERSAQRNYGVQQARGELVFIIDSDMELTPHVVRASVDQFMADAELAGVAIPEESFGDGFWAQCKRLERSFYVGVPWMEAARCFPTQLYRQLGGYDETLVSGEDWDLSRRAERIGRVGRVEEFIRHNEGSIRLWDTLRKKYYYASHAKAYLARHPVASKLGAQVGPLQRYKLFLSQPRRLFADPVLGVAMLAMKTAEFAAGGLGYVRAARPLPEQEGQRS